MAKRIVITDTADKTAGIGGKLAQLPLHPTGGGAVHGAERRLSAGWSEGRTGTEAAPSEAERRMRYEANESRRHNIPRARYRVEDWAAYDVALRRPGSVAVCCSKRRR